MIIEPIFPTKTMLITRKGNEVSDLKELSGKKIAISKSTSGYDALIAIEKKYSIDIEFLFIDDKTEVFRLIKNGDAFATCRDANIVMNILKDYPGLSISKPITEAEYLGWGINKNNLLLASILRKYIKYAKETDAFNPIWKKQYYINYYEYLKLLEFE